MEINTIVERAALLGADIRCVGSMMPSDGPNGGIKEQCAVLVQRDGASLTVMRHDFRSEGMSPKRARITDNKAGATRLDAFLATIAALQARERAVAGFETEQVVYPPWSFSVDQLAAEIAAADGFDLSACSRPGYYPRTFTPFHGGLASAEDAWQWSRETLAVRAWNGDAPPGSGRSVDAEMKGSRLIMRVLSPKNRRITLREEQAGTWLLAWGTTLPDTVLGSLKGRRLCDIVEGLGENHTITAAKNSNDATWLRVKGPRVPLAAAPDGVNADWLNF